MAPKKKVTIKTTQIKQENQTIKNDIPKPQIKNVLPQVKQTVVQQPKKQQPKPQVEKNLQTIIPTTQVSFEKGVQKVEQKQVDNTKNNNGQYKILKLDNQAEDQQDLLEKRKLRFSMIGTQVDVQEAQKIRIERIKKFGGSEIPNTKQELKKRAQKFGTNFLDKNQQKKKILARKQKFGNLNGESEDTRTIQQRRKKFGGGTSSNVDNNDEDEILKRRAEKFNVIQPIKKRKI